MNDIINITSGTPSVLNQIKLQHPKRHMSLFQSASYSNHILIDNSKLKTIFHSPIQYQINRYKGSKRWGLLTSFIHLTLNNRQIKVLSACINKTLQLPLTKDMISFYYLTDKANPSNKILLTNWKNFKSYVNWKKISFIHCFTKSKNDYYQNIFYNIN